MNDTTAGIEAHAARAARPRLCAVGHTLLATAHYPPRPTASATVNGHLFAAFDPASFSVVTCAPPESAATTGGGAEARHHVQSAIRFSRRLDLRWRDVQVPWSVRRVRRLLEAHDARALVGVYPDFHFLDIARRAAKASGVPWVAYLHDLFAENMAHTSLAKRAARLQAHVFDEAAHVFVMSEGMAEVARKTYGRPFEALPHIYPEPIPAALPEAPPTRHALWSGRIYQINANAVKRVARALERVGCPLLVTTPKPRRALAAYGLTGDTLQTAFFPERADYRAALGQSALLLNALDAPDESPIHPDELATIFPTKTPEYLAAGRPMLVHCPEHYYLARFVRAHGCGLVVPERDPVALAEAVRFLLDDGEEVRRMRLAALEAARQFAAPRIAARLQSVVNRVAAPA